MAEFSITSIRTGACAVPRADSLPHNVPNVYGAANSTNEEPVRNQHISPEELREALDTARFVVDWGAGDRQGEEAVQIGRALLGLEEQLSAPCRCDKCRDCVAAEGYERLQEQLETALRQRDEVGATLGEPCAECGHIDWRSDGYLENLLRGSREQLEALRGALENIAHTDDPEHARALARHALAADSIPASSPPADRHNRVFPTATGAYDQPKESPAFDPASEPKEGT